MSDNTNPEPKVVTPEGAIKMIGCSRTKFYEDHYHKLEQKPKIGKNVYFDHEFLVEYIKKIKPAVNPYQIVNV